MLSPVDVLSFTSDDRGGIRRRQRMLFWLLKSCLREHGCELIEGVRVSGGSGREHDEAEGRRRGRAYPVGIWHEFDERNPAAWNERAVHAPQEADAVGRGKMVQEVRDED